jgi:DNA-binding transcriptional ArsR family regulator
VKEPELGAETKAESVQTITDARVLAAMSHRARRRLLDALIVDGPSTVGMLAARSGLAVGSVSHHLKVLAQASLIEAAPDLARDRRERWWKVSSTSRRWSSTAFGQDPAAEAVVAAAESLNLEHQVEKVRTWFAQRDGVDQEWTDAAFSADTWLRLTPAELSQLSGEMADLLHRWRDRAVPVGPGPDGREPSSAPEVERRSVFVFAHGVPAEP